MSKRYKVLHAIHVGGRIEVGSIVDFEDDVAKPFGPDVLLEIDENGNPVDPTIEVKEPIVDHKPQAGDDCALPGANGEVGTLVEQDGALVCVPKPKAGDACQTGDGKAGTLQDDGNGGLTCVASAADTEVASTDAAPAAATDTEKVDPPPTGKQAAA